MGKSWTAFAGLVLVLSLESVAAEQKASPREALSSRDRVLELSVMDRGTKQPVARVEITILSNPDGTKDFRATTDNLGRCTVPVPPRKDQVEYFVIQSWKEGFVPIRLGWLDGPREPGVPASYTLVLDRGAPIGGLVRDEEGRPVAGARLFVGRFSHDFQVEKTETPSMPPTRSLVSDSEGRWGSALLPASVERGKLNFRVEHSGFVSNRWAFDRALSIKDLRAMRAVVVLQKGFTLSGEVMNERGEAVTGAAVTFWSSKEPPRHHGLFPWSRVYDAQILQELESEDPTPRIRQKTDAAGHFRFENCPAGISMVTVKVPGFAAGVKEVRFGPPDPEHEPLPAAPLEAGGPAVSIDANQVNKAGPCTPSFVFRLSKGRSIRGRVVDGDGKPVVGAIVIPEVKLTGFDRLGWRGKTDADGRFVWSNAPTEAITLNVAAAKNSRLVEHLVRRGEGLADVTIAVSVW